jgi:membrane carboxypeptidase/penicillin-binding protein
MHIGRRSGKDWVAELSTRSFVATLLVTFLTVALACAGFVVLGFAGAYQFLAPEIPAAAELREVRTQMPLAVYSRDGKLIAQIGEQRRIPVA